MADQVVEKDIYF